MSDDETEYVGFNVEKRYKEAAKANLEHGGLSKICREAVIAAAGGEEMGKRAMLEEQLDEADEKISRLKREIREKQAELEDEQNRKERLQRSLDELRDEQSKYREKLGILEGALYDGRYVTKEWKEVNRAAAVGDLKPEEVIDDLKDRNPGVPPWAFMPKSASREDWNGMDVDEGKNTKHPEREDV